MRELTAISLPNAAEGDRQLLRRKTRQNTSAFPIGSPLHRRRRMTARVSVSAPHSKAPRSRSKIAKARGLLEGAGFNPHDEHAAERTR